MALHPKLDPGTVHVWQAPLSHDAARLALLRRHLSEEELSRAERIRVTDVRNRFIAGRGVLREILGRYLDEAPETVQLSLGASGKPNVAAAGSKLRFNLSHSGELLVVVLSNQQEVGVDLEKVREDLPFAEIGRRYFSPAEQQTLLALPQNLQLAAFYRCWTRKEAYLKGTGHGFTFPCNSFEVSLHPNAEPALLQHRLNPEETKRWWLADLKVPEGYCAALALAGEGVEICYLFWE